MKILKNLERTAKNILITLVKVFIKQEEFDPKDVNTKEFKHVLIVHLDRKVGNLILSTPMIEAAKKIFTSASIDILVASQVQVLLEANPYLSNIYKFEHLDFIKNPLKIFSLRNSLKNQKYDAVIESSNPSGSSFLNGFVTYLSGAQYRIGFSGGGGELFTNIHLTADKKDHYYLSKQKLIEIFSDQKLNLTPKIFTDKNEIEKVKAYLRSKFNLDESQKLIGIWIGARDKKKWDLENFISVYNRILISTSYFPILLFGIEEFNQYNQIDKEKFTSLRFSDLRELKNFVSCCNIFISGDTGPLHYAYALRVTTIGIFLQDNYHTYGYNVEGRNYLIKPSRTEKMVNEIIELIKSIENKNTI